MKNFLLSIVLLVASQLTVSAARSSQNDDKNVSVTGAEVVRTGNNTVSIAFRVNVGNEVTAKNRSLVIRPVLSGIGGGQSELPPIIIRGARAKASAETQALSALGIDSGGHYLTSNGNSIDYWASIPWQDWMRGSQLVFNGLNAGKGKATEVTIGTVADNLLTAPANNQPQPSVVAQVPVTQAPVAEVVPQQQPSAVWQAPQNVQPAALQPQVVYQAPAAPVSYYTPDTRDQGVVVQRSMSPFSVTRDYSPVKGYYDIPERQQSNGTIGDELAARFTFVEPVARFNRAKEASSMDVVFDYNMPLVYGTGTIKEDSDVSRFVDMTREGAVYFKFERGSSVMDRDLGENNTMHVNLVSAIRVLDANPDTRIAQIVVVGFSAPEGVLDEKETLAMERAGVARDFLTANSRVDPSLISIYNGSVDWITLRALVAESNMPEKYKVLEIIDNIPAWNTSRKQSRLGRLMDLNDGEVFRYMRQNFFPQLRQTGAYVKIYYENIK